MEGHLIYSVDVKSKADFNTRTHRSSIELPHWVALPIEEAEHSDMSRCVSLSKPPGE